MSTPVTTSLNPWGKPVSQANVVRSHQRGRICAHEGCNTILSIYNPATFCAAHLKQAHSGRPPGAARSVQGRKRPVTPASRSSGVADLPPRGKKRAYRSETEVVGAAGVVAVSGEMDQHTTSRFKRDIDEAITLTSGDLILDLSDLDLIDSTALGIMFSALQRLSGESRRLIVVVTQGQVMRVLTITGLDTMFRIAGSRSEALRQVVARV